MPVASEVTPPMSSLGCRAVRAHGPRREVALDAGHPLPVGHHPFQPPAGVVGVVQHRPAPSRWRTIRPHLSKWTAGLVSAGWDGVWWVCCAGWGWGMVRMSQDGCGCA